MTATEQGAGRESPEARGEAARERTTELQQRRADLAAGLPSNAETAKNARLRAQESMQR